MNDFTKEQLWEILRAVESGEIPPDQAESRIKEMISDIEDDAFRRGQESVYGAYNNLM